MRKREILVVDDEPKIGKYLSRALKVKDYNVRATSHGTEVLNLLRKKNIDLVITDLRMPEINGLELLKLIKKESPPVGVIVMSGYGTIEDAVESIKIGAFDFITKPFTIKKISELTRNYFKYSGKNINSTYSSSDSSFGDILGRSEKMKEVFTTIERIADTDVTVFIQGPTGTGKELVAKEIQVRSNLKDEPYIKVNCAALPAGLMESEIFGHVKGAFTGAIKERKGMFELADGGTILLDEISEMELGLQAKLLRVLQTGEFQSVGAEIYKKVKVRVIATTNRNIEHQIKEGKFREDLYYRLNVVPLHLPSLEERKDDIPLLAHYFVRRLAIKYGKPELRLSEDAINTLISMNFQGNVRELENIIERAVVLCKTDEIRSEDLQEKNKDKSRSSESSKLRSKSGTIEEIEKELILETLNSHGGNRSKAADKLGITARTLRNKLNKYKQENSL